MDGPFLGTSHCLSLQGLKIIINKYIIIPYSLAVCIGGAVDLLQTQSHRHKPTDISEKAFTYVSEARLQITEVRIRRATAGLFLAQKPREWDKKKKSFAKCDET